MELELEVDAIAGVLVVAVRGRLIAGQLDSLDRCLSQAMDAERPVVLDLHAADEVDRDAIRMLERAHARLAARMRVVVRRGGAIHAALKDTGLAHTLALHSSAAAAMAAAEPLVATGGLADPPKGTRV
jgi:anti-anti-sigma regulatory factor